MYYINSFCVAVIPTSLTFYHIDCGMYEFLIELQYKKKKKIEWSTEKVLSKIETLFYLK